MFKTHLILAKYQFIARRDRDYNADILYFDMGLNHISRISDYLTDGLIEKFLNEQTSGMNYDTNISLDINISENETTNVQI